MRKRKQKNNNKLIPKLPFSVNEVAELVNHPNSVLQEKLIEFSKTSAYKFLSDLNTNTVKTPAPGSSVKLSKKEMQLFEEYVVYKMSPQYQMFQALQILVNEYNYELGKATREEAGIRERYQDENEKIISVTDKDEEYDYAAIVDVTDSKGRRQRVIKEIDKSEYDVLRYRTKIPGVY